LYGLLVGLPTAALAGPIFGVWIARPVPLPSENPMADQLAGSTDMAMPGFGISLVTILLPVILMLLASVTDDALLDFVGQPVVSLVIALVSSFWSLTRARGLTREQILKLCNECLAPTATILLVIAAGGGFNQVLVQSGVGTAIAGVARGGYASPLLLAWTIAALIRVATGS